MQQIKSSRLYKRISARQHASAAIAHNMRESGYIRALPKDYVSAGSLTKSDMIDRLDRFSRCGSLVEIAEYAGGRVQAQNANYCGLLGCWHCGARTEKRRYARIKSKIEQAVKAYPYAYHVVFTIADGENVRDLSLFLRQSLTRWRKYGQMRNGRPDRGEYGKVRAALFSQEIVEGKNSRAFHTHAHAILWCDKMLDFRVYDKEKRQKLSEQYAGNIPKKILEQAAIQHFERLDGSAAPASKLSAEWHKATLGKATSINARALFSEKEYKSALDECIKYATKLNENAPNRAAQIIADCHGLRFFSTCRKLRFSPANGDNPPEMPENTETPAAVYGLAWSDKIRNYSFFNCSPKPKDPTRAAYQAEAAQVLAKYRKERNALIVCPPAQMPLYIALDGLKSKMRQSVKVIWRKRDRISWLPFAAFATVRLDTHRAGMYQEIAYKASPPAE